MLTESVIEEIRERLLEFESYQFPLRHGFASRAIHSACDVPILLAEVDRLAGQLADVWLLLDGIVRHTTVYETALIPHAIAKEIGDLGRAAAAMLRMQQAPGWTDQAKASLPPALPE